jgi:hypothetical protein
MEPGSIFVTPLHLTIIHSLVNSLSPNHHKFILIFLITGPYTDLILTSTEYPYYPSAPHDHLNLTSLTLLATSVKRHYTMTNDCDRKMSLWNKHLSNGSDLHVSVFQFTCHLFHERLQATLSLTRIFTCNDRTCWFMKQAPRLYYGVHLNIYIYINLTSSIRIPNAGRIPHKNSVLTKLLAIFKSDALSHCIPNFSKCLTNVQYMISSWSNIEINTEEPQQFHLHMELDIKLDKTMLDKVLYVADKSAKPW